MSRDRSRIRVEEDGPVLEITFDHPPANAIDEQASRDFTAAFDRLEASPHLRCAIVASAGERIYCAGWDLKSVAAGGLGEDFGPHGFMGLARPGLAKPVIAAVDGLAVGGGFEFALMAHMVICTDTAEFGLPELQRGFIPEAGGLWRVMRRLPANIGYELLLTGRRLTAAEGARLGFVNRIVPRGELRAAARAMAAQVAASAPLAVAALLEIAGAVEGLPEAQAFAVLRAGLPAHRRMRESQDFHEGPRAFAEKRPPRWTGR